MVKRPPLDLSQRQPVPAASIPSFSPLYVSSGTLAQTGNIFQPKAACTVRWIIVQVLGACTVQLLNNGEPASAPYQLASGQFVRFAGRFIANNVILSISLTPATAAVYEVVWTKEIGSHLTLDQTSVFSGVPAAAASPVLTSDAANGPVTPGAAASKSELGGGVVATAAAAGTVGQQMALQMDVAGCLRINPAAQTGSFTTYHNTVAQGVITSIFTVPTGKKWRFCSGFFQLQTQATVGNRCAALTANDVGGNTLCSIYASVVQAASLTNNYTFGQGLIDGVGGVTNQVKVGCPSFVLGPGASISLSNAGGVTGATGDKMLSITIAVEEYND